MMERNAQSCSRLDPKRAAGTEPLTLRRPWRGPTVRLVPLDAVTEVAGTDNEDTAAFS